MDLRKLFKRFTLFILIFVSWSAIYAATYFVDNVQGNDAFNGKSLIPLGGNVGPKKTINGAIAVAGSGDNVEVTGGTYIDRVIYNRPFTVNFRFDLTTTVTIKSWRMAAVGGVANFSGKELFVEDSIILNNGKIEATATGFVFRLSKTVKVIGGNKKSYIDGRLTRDNDLLTVSNLFFPMGTGNDYRPCWLSFNQTTGINGYTAEVRQGLIVGISKPATVTHVANTHFWILRHAGTSAVPTKFKVSLHYDTAGAVDDEVPFPARVRVVRNIATQTFWKDLGGSGTVPLDGEATSSVLVDTLGRFTFGNALGGQNPLGKGSPFAKFGFKGTCEGELFTFSDSSYSYKLGIKRYKYNFGTGIPKDTSNLKNPSFVFNGAGPFNVQLIVWDNANKSDTFFKLISIKRKPNADFTANNACFKQLHFFTDVTTIPSADTVKIRKWDMGDGGSRIPKSFSYSYGGPGTYTVNLYVESNSGCKDTQTKKITVYNKINLDYSFKNVCLGETTIFSATGGNVGDTINLFQWYLNGGFKTAGKMYSETFASAGNRNVRVIANTQNGCKDTITKQIEIFAPPTTAFILDKSIVGNDSFQCFSTNKFTWKGISNLPQSQTANHSYFLMPVNKLLTQPATIKNQGLIAIKCVVTTNKGCKDSITKNFLVYDSIKTQFVSKTFCLPKPATFKSSANAGSAGIVQQNWFFGDGNSNLGNNDSVSRSYSSGGNYQVKLIIKTNQNCIDSATQNIKITNLPTITIAGTGIGKNPFCEGDSFEAEAKGGDSIKWLDNNSTIRKRLFKTNGVFKARAFTSSFCFVTDSIIVAKFPAVIADAGKDTGLVFGRYITLKADGGLKYSWTPRNLCDFPDSVRTRIKPSSSNTFYVKVIDGNGCIGFDSVQVKVRQPITIRIPNLITPNNDLRNDAWDLREVPFVESCKFRIFNQLGELVYTQNNNYLHNWNGIDKNGKALPDGTYLYEITCPSEKEPMKGYLQIMR